MITKTDCCIHTLEILLSHVKTLDDLTIVENTIETYQEKFKIDLIVYKRQVRNMRLMYGKKVEVQKGR